VIVVLVTGAVAIPSIIARQFLRHGPSAGATVVASTGIGERHDVRLSDGTLVMLAPKSELRYPAQFGAGARNVSLRGEAAFSVAHDKTRPFTVSAAGLSVRVLGTEFDVRENGADSTTDVVVASGRVWLQTATDSTSPILTARQLGHVNVVSGRIVVRKDVAIDRYMSWRTGHVRVEKTPLRDVIPELKRWFDVDFVLSDTVLASRTVSADLRVGNDASLDVVLSAITLAIDARYVHVGRTITLRRR
jgi:ferric-dicitrate binding protein FerR (iron transport regulator)